MPRPGTVRFDFYPDTESQEILSKVDNRNEYINRAVKLLAGVDEQAMSDEQIRKLAKRLAAELKKLG